MFVQDGKRKVSGSLKFDFGQGCSILAPVFIHKMTFSFITSCRGLLDPKRKSHVVNCNVLFIRKPPKSLAIFVLIASQNRLVYMFTVSVFPESNRK